MTENAVVRLPGHLDPTAQEFRPTYPAHHHLFLSPPQPQPQQPLPYFPPQQDVIFSQYVNTHHQPPSLPPPPPQQLFIPPSMPPVASAPTRAVLLSAVPPEVSESCLRRELEVFGDVRAVQMERVREGIVTVHFYDLRAAHAALEAVRDQHMQHQHRLRLHFSTVLSISSYGPGSGLTVPPPPPTPPPAPGLVSGRAVWAHFTIPVTHAYPDGINQGTLVIFNLDPNVTAHTLKDIFLPFGNVKELRETPMKRQQRFVEFYDVRDATKALIEMNGKEINGRSVMIEYSRPGGHNNKKFYNYHHNNYHHNFNQNLSHFNHNYQGSNNYVKPLPHSPPPPPPPPPPPQVRILPFRNRKTSSPRQQQLVRRRKGTSPCSEESLEAAMNQLSLRPGGGNENGKKGCSNNAGTTTSNKKGSGNGNGNGSCSSSGSSSSKQKTRPWKGRQKNFDPRYLIKEEAIIDASSECKDTRTTVMIKNIPNKYSQKLLLNMLDNHCIHCNEQIGASGDYDQIIQPLSSYDFVYLPIDFNNKCNVGYGFVNMTSPEATLRLYKAFHHQHWEVFNSRKICEVTYARVQGLEALKEHFKNSKFACENDEYLPVVFTPPRDGRQLSTPLPIVFTNTQTDMDGGDQTSSTTSTITHPSLSEDYDHFDHDEEENQHQQHHIIININGFNDIISNDDDVSRSSSDGSGDVINDHDDIVYSTSG